MDLLHQILSRYWGYETFRPQQEEIIRSVMNGCDTLALLPTGGGKSLCYQIPALAQEGICLVVSPLIALMKDQVENLKKRGIGALMIYSGMTRKDVIRTLENARQPYFKFLYVSPERLETSLFKEYLPALHVNLIAVDEAHCISQWGYDFRPSYLNIAALREELKDVPVLAVTASATTDVQKDICQRLSAPLPLKGGVSTAPPLLDDESDEKDYEYLTADPFTYKLIKEFVKEHRSRPTVAEDVLWEQLRGKQLAGFKFRRQHIVGNYIADFINLKYKLAIEVDGLIHQLPENKASDEERTFWFHKKGYQVIRFTNEAVINHTHEVVKQIHFLLKQRIQNAKSQSGPLRTDTPSLGGRGAWSIFRQSFERKNLSYSVFEAEAKSTRLVDIVKKVDGSGIVYCKTRKRTTEVAALLQLHKISANFYHAGLSSEERSQRQQDWIHNKIRIIVCTNAFGMGIDKPDVRLVVHIDPPDCLENYYQEAGRCGRDGKKAYAVLLYDEKDTEELEALHTVRYPSFEVIKTIYEALYNFLQIPVNHGQDRSYAFRFDDFVRNFHLNVHQALYSLQALESDGWIAYNEKSFTPPTVQFTTGKELLYEFYRNHPEHEQLLVTLLRTYEGIFDYPTFVSENLLAKLLRKEESEIQSELQKITGYGIIRYAPQNDAPQLLFLKNRVVAADLKINLAAYQQRKEVFCARVQQMLRYTKSAECRSRFIGQYFGDAQAHDCGICDNCLQKKKAEISAEEFNAIAEKILSHLTQRQSNSSELLHELKAIRHEKVWQVLRFLQAENKVHTSTDGHLFVA